MTAEIFCARTSRKVLPEQTSVGYGFLAVEGAEFKTNILGPTYDPIY